MHSLIQPTLFYLYEVKSTIVVLGAGALRRTLMAHANAMGCSSALKECNGTETKRTAHQQQAVCVHKEADAPMCN